MAYLFQHFRFPLLYIAHNTLNRAKDNFKGTEARDVFVDQLPPVLWSGGKKHLTLLPLIKKNNKKKNSLFSVLYEIQYHTR